MKIDKNSGKIVLSKTDTKRWHNSTTFRQDVMDLMGDMVITAPESFRCEHDRKDLQHRAVLVYGAAPSKDDTPVLLAALWTKVRKNA